MKMEEKMFKCDNFNKLIIFYSVVGNQLMTKCMIHLFLFMLFDMFEASMEDSLIFKRKSRL